MVNDRIILKHGDDVTCKENIKGKIFPQHIAALSVCMGSVAAGAILGWTSNISEEMKEGNFRGINIDNEAIGWIGSFETLGGLVICIPIGILCDCIGRKWTMLALIVPFTLGWLLIIFATNLTMIYFGRFISGAAGGAFCVTAPIYTSEIAQPAIRGALGSYFQLLLTVGILFAYLLAYAANIQLYTIICACLPFVFGICFFMQPETPIYLIKKGKDEKARKALLYLRGKSYDVEKEMDEIKMQLEEENCIKKPFMESIKKKAAKKATIICFGLMFFQQLSGVNAIIYYTGSIFASAELRLNPKNATIIIGVMQVAATLFSTILIDKLGRKFLLAASAFLMAISTAVQGLYFTLKDRNLISDTMLANIGSIPVLALCLFIAVYSIGFGPIPWMISTELFPPEIKTIAISAACCFNWFLAFLVTKFYFNLKYAIGVDLTFYLFSGISFLGAIFVLVFVPETKNKTLAEIQQELNDEKHNAS